MAHRVELPCSELNMFYGAGWSTVALGQRYSCSPTTVARELRRCAIEVRPARFRSKPLPEAALRELYSVQQLPIAHIAQQLGVAVSTVGNWRRKYGIPTRPRR